LEDNFWLFCGLWVGLGSYFLGKYKSRGLIENGECSKETANKYLFNFAVWILVPSFAFWVLQFTIGSGAGVDFTLWPNPQKFIALSILIALWSYLFIWTFFMDGAKPLGMCLRLIGNFPKSMLSPTAVKFLVVAVVGSGVASLFMQRV
jgi:hypothetical protein